MSELGKRLLTALILLLLVWGWYFHLPESGFAVGLALLGWVATCELVLLVRLPQPLAYMFAALPVWTAFSIHPDLVLLMLMIVVWFALFVITSCRQEQASFAPLFAAIWLLGWLFCFAYALAVTHESVDGRALVIGACLAVWTSDTAAYFVGRRFGRRKLCPAISPGKSIEGLMGALLFAVPVALFCWLFWWQILSPPAALLLAVICVLAGVLGDLSESAVKRLVGAKDSGNWLPGHGGILDRIDAIIMAVPVSWAVWSLL